jgi:hypothetical protein
MPKPLTLRYPSDMLRQILVQTHHIMELATIHQMLVAPNDLLNVMEQAEYVEA